MLNPWNGTGPSDSVGSAPITLRVNGFSSSSEGDRESANLKNRLGVVVVGSRLSRNKMRDRWELSFCYNFDITPLSYKTVFCLTVLVLVTR